MKQTPLIISVVAVLLAAAALLFNLTGSKKCKKVVETEGTEAAAAAGDIVYVRLDSLLVNYDMYNDKSSALEAKMQSAENDLASRGRKLESDGNAFQNQINKGLLTRSQAEQQQQSLLQRQQNLQELAGRKQAELAEEQAVMTNQIMDAIHTFLEEYRSENGFAAIITIADPTSVIDPARDVTAAVVEGLNAEYVKTRNVKADTTVATDAESETK